MWRKPALGSLLAVICCMLNHAHGQATQSPEFYQNLTCLTRDLLTMICHWDTPNFAGGVLYEVCYRASGLEDCFETGNNSLQIELYIPTVQIKITAKNLPGPPVISFTKDITDIPYVPHTPQVLSLVADYQSDVLSAEWTVDSSDFLNAVKVKWEINVLRGEDLQLVKNETFTIEWNINRTTFQWSWISDYPLNCTSHSVRVRCYVYDEAYFGPIKPSEWSPIKTVPGSDEELAVYPIDKVLLVGSNMTICCKVMDPGKLSFMKFVDTDYPITVLGTYSGGIPLLNLNLSGSSGDNIMCLDETKEETLYGGVVFVGYPPDDPQNFSCDARDLTIINCTWNTGRDTNLYGTERGTKYTLYERFSGLNRSCTSNTNDLIDYNCSYNVNKEQTLYNFLLLGTNPLGASNASLVFNVTERLYPSPVERIGFINRDATRVSISWVLPGTFTSVNLLCETEMKKQRGEIETRNVTLLGQTGTFYTYDLDHLHPFTKYTFRVRCSSQDHFWKWSDWSQATSHQTLESAPSRKLDIWTEPECNPDGCVINVYWKHLQPRDANGEVTSYSVVWKPLNGNNMEAQSQFLSKDHNNHTIHVSGNDYRDYEIIVAVHNAIGSSPPSISTTVRLPNDVEVQQVSGDGSGVNITWTPDRNFTCDYIVKWIPSTPLQGTDLLWKRVSSHAPGTTIHAQQFQSGTRYNVSVYGCIEHRYQLVKSLAVYSKELSPKMAPNFTITETTSKSIQVIWEPVSENDLRGFLQGYLVYVVKNQNDSSYVEFQDLVRHSETKLKNITDPAVRKLKIEDLQSGTSYQLGLQAYNRGGRGPIKTLVVVTRDNAVGLILAILIPIVVAAVLAIVTSVICYQKREWIKETFYPDIPNPENSKALQFQKSVSEGTKTIKTLEMNPCTPSSVEVVESFYTVPKILDTEMNSPMTEDGQLPEDGSEVQNDHTVISYCQPTVHEDSSNPVVEGSATPSQVVYIDVQSMYQPQANSEEEPETDIVDGGGYKPQMQLPIKSGSLDNQTPSEDALAEFVGYRPQGQANGWAADSPESPSSLESENASFGSPCSTNSRHFLIPAVDTKEPLKPTHAGWSISSLFQNKQDD